MDRWTTHVHTLGHRYVQTCGHMYRQTDMNTLNMNRWNISIYWGTVTSSFFVIKRLLLVLEMMVYFFEKSRSYSIGILFCCVTQMLLAIDIYLLLDLLLIVPVKALVNYQNLYGASPLSNGPSSCKIWANMTGNVIPAIKEDNLNYFHATQDWRHYFPAVRAILQH